MQMETKFKRKRELLEKYAAEDGYFDSFEWDDEDLDDILKEEEPEQLLNEPEDFSKEGF